MDIYGLSKLTLLDYQGKTACTVFTGGCNFRCPYCHNASLVLNFQSMQKISEEDFFAFLNKRKNMLEGVCVSGGEPTLNKDLPDFLKNIKDKGFSVKLDTNGSNPDILNKFISEELVDYVAMDIKNSPEMYGITVGISDFDITPVKKSAAVLLNSYIEYEFRTTAVKELHNAQRFKEIGEWLNGGRAYYIQQFVNRGIIGDNLSPFSVQEMSGFLEIVKPHFKKCELRGV